MQSSKITMNLREGLLNVEGEEAFVREIYHDFKDMLNGQEGAGKSGKKAAPRGQESYRIIPSLDFPSKGGKGGLKDFFSEKRPTTAFEYNVVFVYYLQKIQGMQNITPDHVYTCYKYAGVKLPSAFRQSILDTSHKKQFLDTRSLKDIRLAAVGENYVDYELPKGSHSSMDRV